MSLASETVAYFWQRPQACTTCPGSTWPVRPKEGPTTVFCVFTEAESMSCTVATFWNVVQASLKCPPCISCRLESPHPAVLGEASITDVMQATFQTSNSFTPDFAGELPFLCYSFFSLCFLFFLVFPCFSLFFLVFLFPFVFLCFSFFVFLFLFLFEPLDRGPPGPPSAGPPQFSRFFSLSHHYFLSSLSWGSSR